MICDCGNKMKVIETRFNPIDNETYRKLKCCKCNKFFYTCECEIEYESIKEDYNKYYRN